MAEKKRQHTLPEFYLNGFVDPRSPVDQTAFLWVADLIERRVRRRAPTNVAWKPHFYSVPDGKGGYDSTLEDYIGKIEDRAAPLFVRLLRLEMELSRDDRGILATFAGLQAARVQYHRLFVESMLPAIAEWASKLDPADPRSLAAFEANPTRELAPPDEVELTRILSDPNFQPMSDPSPVLQTMMYNAEWLAGKLHSMRWALLRARTGLEFLTGDNPANWIDPTLGRTLHGHGLGNRNTEFTFPISPQLCLLATWIGPEGVFWAEPEVVNEFNWRTTRFGIGYVYSASEALASNALAQRG